MKNTRSNKDRPLYMISVAAQLAGMHPQTLRIYERKQLVRPQRSGGNTRLYSDADIDRLRLIQHLTQEEGINLAGVMRIIELQGELERVREEMAKLQAVEEHMERRIAEEAERVHRSYKAEIVMVRRGALAPRHQRG